MLAYDVATMPLGKWAFELAVLEKSDNEKEIGLQDAFPVDLTYEAIAAIVAQLQFMRG